MRTDPTIQELVAYEKQALDVERLSSQHPWVQAIRGMRMVKDPVGGPLMQGPQAEKLRDAFFAALAEREGTHADGSHVPGSTIPPASSPVVVAAQAAATPTLTLTAEERKALAALDVELKADWQNNRREAPVRAMRAALKRLTGL